MRQRSRSSSVHQQALVVETCFPCTVWWGRPALAPNHLPSAHTCANHLVLPVTPDRAVLQQKLDLILGTDLALGRAPSQKQLVPLCPTVVLLRMAPSPPPPQVDGLGSTCRQGPSYG